jgi:hypothetical protein
MHFKNSWVQIKKETCYGLLYNQLTYSLDNIANKKFTSNKKDCNGKQSLKKESDVLNHSGLFK